MFWLHRHQSPKQAQNSKLSVKGYERIYQEILKRSGYFRIIGNHFCLRDVLFKMQSKGLKIEMEAWHNQEVCKTWKKIFPLLFCPCGIVSVLYIHLHSVWFCHFAHSLLLTVEVKLSHSNILLELVLIFKKYIKLVVHNDLQNCHSI